MVKYAPNDLSALIKAFQDYCDAPTSQVTSTSIDSILQAFAQKCQVSFENWIRGKKSQQIKNQCLYDNQGSWGEDSSLGNTLTMIPSLCKQYPNYQLYHTPGHRLGGPSQGETTDVRKALLTELSNHPVGQAIFAHFTVDPNVLVSHLNNPKLYTNLRLNFTSVGVLSAVQTNRITSLQGVFNLTEEERFSWERTYNANSLSPVYPQKGPAQAALPAPDSSANANDQSVFPNNLSTQASEIGDQPGKEVSETNGDLSTSESVQALQKNWKEAAEKLQEAINSVINDPLVSEDAKLFEFLTELPDTLGLYLNPSTYIEEDAQTLCITLYMRCCYVQSYTIFENEKLWGLLESHKLAGRLYLAHITLAKLHPKNVQEDGQLLDPHSLAPIAPYSILLSPGYYLAIPQYIIYFNTESHFNPADRPLLPCAIKNFYRGIKLNNLIKNPIGTMHLPQDIIRATYTFMQLKGITAAQGFEASHENNSTQPINPDQLFWQLVLEHDALCLATIYNQHLLIEGGLITGEVKARKRSQDMWCCLFVPHDTYTKKTQLPFRVAVYFLPIEYISFYNSLVTAGWGIHTILTFDNLFCLDAVYYFIVEDKINIEYPWAAHFRNYFSYTRSYPLELLAEFIRIARLYDYPLDNQKACELYSATQLPGSQGISYINPEVLWPYKRWPELSSHNDGNSNTTSVEYLSLSTVQQERADKLSSLNDMLTLLSGFLRSEKLPPTLRDQQAKTVKLLTTCLTNINSIEDGELSTAKKLWVQRLVGQLRIICAAPGSEDEQEEDWCEVPDWENNDAQSFKGVAYNAGVALSRYNLANQFSQEDSEERYLLDPLAPLVNKQPNYLLAQESTLLQVGCYIRACPQLSQMRAEAR
jgi:hypothetical protein